MTWIHDTGYEPAYQHSGYPAIVLPDGTDTATASAQVDREAIGWRSACDCGWRGEQLYSREQWPSRYGLAPDEVDGWETGTATFAEWDAHLHSVVPELAVHDLAQDVDKAQRKLIAAVRSARAGGVPWSVLAAATGMTRAGAQERWGGIDTRGAPRFRRHGASNAQDRQF